MLQDKLVQDGGGVQVLSEEGLLGVGVGALGPDLAVVPHHQLGGKAPLQHILIVVHVVKGDDQRFFPLGEPERVADHMGTALVGDLAPDVLHGHQNIALVIDALQNLVVLVYRHHPVVQTDALGFGQRALMEGVLGIGDDGVEEQVLHHLVRAPGLCELVLRPVGPDGVVGVRGGGWGRFRGGGGLRGGGDGRGVRRTAAGGRGFLAGGQRCEQRQGQCQGQQSFQVCSHAHGRGSS